MVFVSSVIDNPLLNRRRSLQMISFSSISLNDGIICDLDVLEVTCDLIVLEVTCDLSKLS